MIVFFNVCEYVLEFLYDNNPNVYQDINNKDDLLKEECLNDNYENQLNNSI